MSFKSKFKFVFFAVSSFAIALIVGLFEEGLENANWLTRFNDWIEIFIYFIFIFLGEVIFAKAIFKNYHGVLKAALSVIGGAIIGIFMVITFVLTK